MNRQTWTPIRPDGSIDEAELRRPADTAEPTTWEAALFDATPHEFESDRVAAVFGVAAFEQRHSFRLTLADIGRATAWFSGPYQGEDCTMWCANEACYRLPWSVRGGIRLRLCCDWPLPNVTIVAGPITTQAEADTILPALLAVKAARREAVFAPREAIEVESCFLTGEYAPRDFGGAMAEEMGPRLDAVRVRGGDTPLHPAWVRALRDQARDAGVRFSLAWGTWAPLREIPHSPTLIHTEMYCPFGPDGGVFTKQGPGWQCCTLDDVSYPEDH